MKYTVKYNKLTQVFDWSFLNVNPEGEKHLNSWILTEKREVSDRVKQLMKEKSPSKELVELQARIKMLLRKGWKKRRDAVF